MDIKKRALEQKPLCTCECGEHITGKKKTYLQGHKKKLLEGLPEKLCACGCGLVVENTYKRGHGRRKIRYDKLCACGCGVYIKTNRTFVNGHNWKNIERGSQSEEHRKKNSELHIGKIPWNNGMKMSEEYCQKLSEIHLGQIPWNLGISQTEEHRRKNSESHKGLMVGDKHPLYGIPRTEEQKRKQSELMKGRLVGDKHPLYGIPRTEEQKRKQSEKLKGRISPNIGKKYSLELKMKLSAVHKNRWASFSEEEKNIIIKNMRNGIQRRIGPNKHELLIQSILNDLFPNEYKFVGDFTVVINGKSPDFININGQKKIIEYWGPWWHRNEDPQDRIDIFKPYGYETLIISFEDLKNIGFLKEKLRKFHGFRNTISLIPQFNRV